MTKVSGGRLQALADAIGDDRATIFGYQAAPSLIVARIAAHQQDDDTLGGRVAELGGIGSLRAAADDLEFWFSHAYLLNADGTPFQRPVGRDPHPVLADWMPEGNCIRQKIYSYVDAFHLSSEVPGIHRSGGLPISDRWKDELAEALDRRLPIEALDRRLPITGAPKAADFDLAHRYGTQIAIASSDPLLAPRWTMSGMKSLQHCCRALIEDAAARIGVVLSHIPHFLDRAVGRGEGDLLAQLRAATAGSDLPEPRVLGTHVHCAHTSRHEGRWRLTHFNSETTVVIPDDLLGEEVLVMGGNVGGTTIDYHDHKRHVARLAKRAARARSGGLSISPVLERCMERDGVDRRKLLDQLKEGVTSPRTLGFARDVKKIVPKNGAIDIHLELTKGVFLRRDAVHVLRTTMPDAVIDALVTGPLAKLVDHPMLPPATITKITLARTGSLIARTDLVHPT